MCHYRVDSIHLFLPPFFRSIPFKCFSEVRSRSIDVPGSCMWVKVCKIVDQNDETERNTKVFVERHVQHFCFFLCHNSSLGIDVGQSTTVMRYFRKILWYLLVRIFSTIFSSLKWKTVTAVNAARRKHIFQCLTLDRKFNFCFHYLCCPESARKNFVLQANGNNSTFPFAACNVKFFVNA